MEHINSRTGINIKGYKITLTEGDLIKSFFSTCPNSGKRVVTRINKKKKLKLSN